MDFLLVGRQAAGNRFHIIRALVLGKRNIFEFAGGSQGVTIAGEDMVIFATQTTTPFKLETQVSGHETVAPSTQQVLNLVLQGNRNERSTF